MSKIDLTTITNFLVDQGEFVDESIVTKLRIILNLNDFSQDILKDFLRFSVILYDSIMFIYEFQILFKYYQRFLNILNNS